MIDETEEETPVGMLFARDPMTHTDEQITLMVEKFRKARHSFNLGNKTAGKPEAKKSAAQKKREKHAKVVGKIDLSSLGL